MSIKNTHKKIICRWENKYKQTQHCFR